MKPVIELQHLTKDYGEGRGVFDLNLAVQEGEMVGFVGTNGSGKTTTIRNLMGFVQPTSGHAYIKGLESWSHASEFCNSVGYVPGEIAFPDLPSGTSFLKSQAEFLGVKDLSRSEHIIAKLQLDPRANLKRMSKGMKQKTAIVAALMHDPAIILLDEPTTGLDPLMRDAFLELISEEHARGKTIFMSSHMFGELEKTCDRVALIRNGKIVDVADMDLVRNPKYKQFKIEFAEEEDYRAFRALKYNIVRDQPQYCQVTVSIEPNCMGTLFCDLKEKNVKFISEVKYTLERHFKEILHREKEKEEKEHV